ncbi:hypothetical protein BX666DRAFT_1898797 [Dichotomocladium elegans]|nr:hypothetical protein BX666DRAFT_1898797 [Dichotomocladium elegans]
MSSAEKPRRKPIQIYVPRHRRVATTSDEPPENPGRISSAPPRLDSSNPSEEVVRRGRGQFRAPSDVMSPAVPSPPRIDNASTLITQQELASAMENLCLGKTSPSSPKEDWEDLLGDDDNSEEEVEYRSREIPSRTTAATAMKSDSIEHLTTVLECSGFPASYKTHHIHDIFRIYEDMPGGFKLKWMDDTRVLILFGNAATAKKAYIDNLDNPQAKITPYTGPVEFHICK